jgi:hypothetical protein
LFIKRLSIFISISLIGAAGFLYELTAPLLLSSANYGADGGDYLTAVLTKGVPHPTGYPLYLILSDIVQRIFGGGFVWRQAQASILPAAICAGIVFWLVLNILNKQPSTVRLASAVIASIALSISPLFWAQAVTIEVYALNALMVILGLLWVELVFSVEENSPNSAKILIICLAWICGLGLGNHRTFLLIYPLVGIGIYTLFRIKHAKLTAILSAVGWLSGITTYLILPIRAVAHPPVNWGDASTWQGFVWLVSGGDYYKLLFGIGLQEYPTRFLAWSRLLVEQFGVIGCLTGLWGLFSEKISNRVKWMLGYIFCAYTLFALGYKTNDSLVYLLPAMIVFAIWIGWGINEAWQIKWRGIRVGIILPLLLLLQLGIMLPGRFQAVSVRTGDLAHYAETTLNNSEKDAIIFPGTDGETFALWYYQYGLGIRPDVKIISKGLLQYPWYREQLKKIYPGYLVDN